MKKYLLWLLLAVSAAALGTVEAVTYISDLNTTLPASGDSVSEGAQHIRNLKTALKNTFPNITGAVNPTQAELNYSVGVTSLIQTQLDAKATPANLGLHFLASTTTTTATATVTFVANIDSTYDEYELHIENAVPTTNNAIATLRTSADAGATWNSTAADYDWVLNWASSTSGSVTNGSTNATRIELSANVVSSTTAMGGFSAIVKVFDPAGTTFNKRIQWNSSAASGTSGGSASAIQKGEGAGQREATAAINGLQFSFSAGNIASGAKFKLYGIRKS
jgi:hypothetical protein